MTVAEFKHSQEEARKIWLAALRSGQYEQCQGALGRGGRYCCLGVLCEEFIKHEGAVLELGCDQAGDKTYDLCTGTPPETVRKWVGLRDDEGCIPGDGSLVDRNDSGKSFSEIADVIESNPPGLYWETYVGPDDEEQEEYNPYSF